MFSFIMSVSLRAACNLLAMFFQGRVVVTVDTDSVRSQIDWRGESQIDTDFVMFPYKGVETLSGRRI